MTRETMLPVEAAYERYQRNEITYDEYRRGYADPADAARAAMRLSQARRAVR